MNKIGTSDITSKQLSAILIGTMLGIGAFRLPNDLAAIAYQDSWISATLGSIYPLMMVTFSIYFIKKFPSKNILQLSKECFGAFLGTIFNIAFGVCFVIHTTTVAQGLVNLFIVSIMSFSTNYRLLFIVFAGASYAAYKDLRVLGRVNTVTYFLTIVLSAILLLGLNGGNYKNLLPILGNGLLNISRAAFNSVSAYIGIEILFLIYPFVTDKEKAIWASYKAVLIIVIIYVWFVFISLYFLGVDLLPRYIWSLPTVSKAVQIPVISNFRFLFLALWSIIVFKTIANAFYATTFIFQDIVKWPKKKYIYIILFVLNIFISYQYKDEVTRRHILKNLTPFILVFNISYVLLIIMITHFKKGEKNETQSK